MYQLTTFCSPTLEIHTTNGRICYIDWCKNEARRINKVRKTKISTNPKSQIALFVETHNNSGKIKDLVR